VIRTEDRDGVRVLTLARAPVKAVPAYDAATRA